MSLSLVMPILVGIGILFAAIMAVLFLFKLFYIKVEQGQALIVNDMSSTPKVYFTGALVWPVIHKKEIMQISVLTLEVPRRGKDGLICKDNLRADINVAFYIRVNETPQDVLKVAKSVGVTRASSKEAVDQLFNAKFSEALKTVGKQMNFVELFDNRLGFKEQIVRVIGDDLNGYILEDVAIDYLEQTPIDVLDPNNIMDVEGIRRITERVKEHAEETNRLANERRLVIDRKDTETLEAQEALRRQREEAIERTNREIEIIRAREQAEVTLVQQAERKRQEEARIATQEAVEVAEENKMRQVEIAQKNRERAVVVEAERVEKARALEQVSREREVDLQEIDKQKAVEEEKKLITVIISERIATEKKVAEEEERIKDTRALSAADRQKRVQIAQAEAKAEEDRIREVKAASAQEEKAKHKATEMNVLADAELQAADKRASAQIKLAEGTKAQKAADGLAAARVKEAMADAVEREGIATANSAKAQGIASADVQKAKAKALEEEGLAEAKVMEEKLIAEAKGQEKMGLAKALADREQGLASAQVLRETALAEAEGLVEKVKAMETMSDKAREFEQFKMSLETAYKESMATIAANKEISKENADVLAAALQKAKIEIVGGNGDYFEQFAKGLSLGKMAEGLTKNSTVQAALAKILALKDAGPIPVTPANDPIAATLDAGQSGTN